MKSITKTTLLATVIATTLGSAAWVNAATTPQAGQTYQQSEMTTQVAHAPQGEHRMRGARKGHRRAKMHRGGHGMDRAISRLDLTDEQRDAVFKIRHANAPKLRDIKQKVRAARRSLRELAVSGQFDNAQADKLSTELGQATAAMAKLRAESGAKIYQLLTESQRQELKQKQARHDKKRRHHN